MEWGTNIRRKKREETNEGPDLDVEKSEKNEQVAQKRNDESAGWTNEEGEDRVAGGEHRRVSTRHLWRASSCNVALVHRRPRSVSG